MNWNYLIKYILLHTFDVILIVGSFYGVSTTITQILVIATFPEVFTSIPFAVLLLFYGGLLCFILVPIQLGVGFTAFLNKQTPPFLLTVYFHDEPQTFSDPLLDPLKSRVGFLIILALLAGGYIAWPLFSIYGIYVIAVAFFALPFYSPDIILLFVQNLAIAMGIPMIGLFIFILLGVLVIEKRHHSP